MNRIGFVGSLFVVNIVLGNVCLLGTAFAASPAANPTQELLSREIPMSFNIITCTWVKTEEGWKPAENSPCASGHCLEKELPETPCLSVHTDGERVISPTAVMALQDLPNSPGLHFPPRATESPPPFDGLHSVVLLM